MSGVKRHKGKSSKNGKLTRHEARIAQDDSCRISIFSLLRNGSDFDPFSSCSPGKASKKSVSPKVTLR